MLTIDHLEKRFGSTVLFRDKTRDGFLIRRTAIETGIYCITAMDTANALVTSMEHMNDCKELTLVDIAQL